MEIHPCNNLPKLLLLNYDLLKKFKKRKINLYLTFKEGDKNSSQENRTRHDRDTKTAVFLRVHSPFFKLLFILEFYMVLS